MSDVAEQGGERVAFVMTQQLEIAPGDFDKLSDTFPTFTLEIIDHHHPKTHTASLPSSPYFPSLAS